MELFSAKARSPGQLLMYAIYICLRGFINIKQWTKLRKNTDPPPPGSQLERTVRNGEVAIYDEFHDS